MTSEPDPRVLGSSSRRRRRSARRLRLFGRFGWAPASSRLFSPDPARARRCAPARRPAASRRRRVPGAPPRLPDPMVRRRSRARWRQIPNERATAALAPRRCGPHDRRDRSRGFGHAHSDAPWRASRPGGGTGARAGAARGDRASAGCGVRGAVGSMKAAPPHMVRAQAKPDAVAGLALGGWEARVRLHSRYARAAIRRAMPAASRCARWCARRA
jgi:hypothetical protein